MGPARTTKQSNRRRHRRRHRRSTPPSPSLTKAPTDHSQSSDQQRATSSSLPSDHNSHYSPSPSNSPDGPLYSTAYASCNSLFTTQGYVPVVPLPVFRGEPDECPFAHLLRFDCVCRVNNAAPPALSAHIFPASLDSYAFIWYSTKKKCAFSLLHICLCACCFA
jgi:hypothetical protein